MEFSDVIISEISHPVTFQQRLDEKKNHEALYVVGLPLRSLGCNFVNEGKNSAMNDSIFNVTCQTIL